MDKSLRFILSLISLKLAWSITLAFKKGLKSINYILHESPEKLLNIDAAQEFESQNHLNHSHGIYGMI